MQIAIESANREAGGIGMTFDELRDKILALLKDELLPLMEKKSRDYGGEDCLSNMQDFGWIGAMVRVGDKYNRIKNFLRAGEFVVKEEDIDVTLQDLANYVLLALVLRRREDCLEEVHLEPFLVGHTGFKPLRPEKILGNRTSDPLPRTMRQSRTSDPLPEDPIVTCKNI
jgi:hypothetical protein